jgi:single stranded DNA-binding protein
MNKVILGGRIGWINDQTTAGGVGVTRVSLAETVTRKGQKETQWHKVAGFSKVGDLLKDKFSNGDYLAIEGRLEQSSWESNGETRHKTEVVIEKILWDACRTRSSNDTSSQESNQSQPVENQKTGSAAGGAVYSTEDFEDDVPL